VEGKYGLATVCGGEIRFGDCWWGRNTVWQLYVGQIRFGNCMWGRNTVWRLLVGEKSALATVCEGEIRSGDCLCADSAAARRDEETNTINDWALVIDEQAAYAPTGGLTGGPGGDEDVKRGHQ